MRVPALLAAPWRAFLVPMAFAAAVAPIGTLAGWQTSAGHGGLMGTAMILGAICGYALTALPGWDDGPPLSPIITAALLAIWLIALTGAVAGQVRLIWPLPLAIGLLLLRRRRGSAKRWVVTGAVVAITSLITAGRPHDAMLIAAALVAGLGGLAVPAFLAGIAGKPFHAMRFWPGATAALTATTALWPPAGIAASVCALLQMRAWPLSGARRGAGAMLVAAWLGLAAGLAAHGLGFRHGAV
ncbi:MAG: hypothetical protein Q4G49_16965, partial [Paracoccus sp. (in: a-proteobacteria)]|nr:hypothetical protein [Paracoccus sp. (in: a-proteobacteria)]